MTTKRFTSDYNGDESLITHFLENGKPMTKEEVLNRLNELHEEIQRLQSTLRKVYDDDYYLKEFILCVVNVFASGNNGLSRVRYDMIVDICNMDKTTLKEYFK